MNIQSWMIKSWATLEWYLPPQTEQLPRFKHVGTQVRDDGSCTGLRAGDTVWVAQDDQGHVGLAWEWLEVKPGVVMLADPNSIITNLQFVDDQQQPVYGLAKTVAINRLVHALAWQPHVCELLRNGAETANPGARLSAPAVAARTARLPADQAHHLGTRNQAANPMRWSAPAADLRAVPSASRRVLAAPARRSRSRASDHEEATESVALHDLRRAA